MMSFDIINSDNLSKISNFFFKKTIAISKDGKATVGLLFSFVASICCGIISVDP